MALKFFDFNVRGIDISKYDLNLIVEKLLNKVDFVIVRIGHGTKTDSLFKIFWQALKGKIFRLAYFYLDYYSNYMPEFTGIYGLSDYDWGVVQGKNAWNNQKNDNDKGLVYLDIENGDSDYAPEIETVWGRVETMMDGFFDTYDSSSGLVNGIYASLSKFKLFDKRFRHRPAYVAWYNEDANGKERTRESVISEVRKAGWTGEIHFWQYASDGDTGTDGVGNGLEFGLGRKVMDLDVWMGTETEWETFKGGQMENILLNIPPVAQRDMRWKNVQLGTSNKTIGSHGCVITDVTMMLRYFGIDINPAELNTWLKANGGYQNTNWFVWSVLNKLESKISFGYRYNYAATDEIDAQLLKNMPSIVNVDLIPSTSALDEHWVLVVGKVDGSYIINDPWYGTQFKFEEKYGPLSTGMRIVSTYNYSGELDPLSPITPPTVENPLYRVKIRDGITKLVIRSTPEVKPSNILPGYASGEYSVFEEKNGYGRVGINRWLSINPEYVQRITPPTEDDENLTDAQKISILWNWYKKNN